MRLFCVITLLLFLHQSVCAADNIWTVETLNEHKPWDQLATSRLTIRVEGPLGTLGGGQFRLQRCDARFTIDAEKLRQGGKKDNAEIRGQFKKTNGRLEFAVDELKFLPSYAEQFDSKAVKMKLPTVGDWIELGEWAAERARIFDDAELLKKSRTAYGNAIELEYKTLKATDAEGRFALAEKVASYQLPDSRKQELIHEGLRLQWKAIQKAETADPATWQQLSERLGQQLSGATVPLEEVDLRLKDDYERDPDATYRKVNSALRRQLHRFFFISVIRKQIVDGASADGHDGDQVADQIEKQIPEERVLAEKYRLAKLDFRAAHLTTSTREEIEGLAADYRARGKNPVASKVLTDWIKSHEARRKADGAVGLLQLADEHLSLLGNRAVAVEFLVEANRIDPTLEGAKTRLESLGYQFRNTRWVKANSREPELTEAAAAPSTEINVGMSASNLRKLLGQPRSLARAITANAITEIWSFGPSGSSQLIVRLEQAAGDKEAKVTSVSGN